VYKRHISESISICNEFVISRPVCIRDDQDRFEGHSTAQRDMNRFFISLRNIFFLIFHFVKTHKVVGVILKSPEHGKGYLCIFTDLLARIVQLEHALRLFNIGNAILVL
jgi:hypothetical protein